MFFLGFDDLVVTVLARTRLQGRGAPSRPVLILASILMMVRAYYFGQVIYFSRTSGLEAAAAFATLATVARSRSC